MIVQFDESDLQKWSQFSGDYNPIHFDKEAASRVGWKGAMAHGMLAMLPIKSGLDESAGTGVGRRWNALLKHPIELHSNYSVAVDRKPDPDKMGFSLMDEKNCVQHIRGNYNKSDFCSVAQPFLGVSFEIAPAQISEKIAEFRELFPRVGEFWVFLDALAFSLFVNGHARTVLTDGVPQYASRTETGYRPAMTDFMVVHAMHTVHISPALIGMRIPNSMPQIGYRVLAKEKVENPDSAYVILEIPIWLDNQLSLVIEMCLMVKR